MTFFPQFSVPLAPPLPSGEGATPKAWRVRAFLLFLSAVYCLLSATPAHAACSSPAAVAGKIIYNSTQKIVQYCDNTNWIPAGLPGSGSGGCSSPSRDEGTILYNTDSNVMQFCGGSVWVPMAYPASAAELTSGLVGHWKLDEGAGTSAADSSGNSNTGTMTNFPAGPWTTGQVGGALTFDGTNDDIDVGSGASLDDLPALTIAGWMKPTSGGGNYTIYYKGYYGGIGGYTLTYDDDSQRLFFRSYFNGGSYLSADSEWTGDLYQNDTWQHFAVTWDGGANPSGVRFYLNGREVGRYAPGDVTGTGSRTSDAAEVGVLGGDGTNTFYGLLDDVRVYSRAITAAEVSTLYTQGNKLVAHYELDETSGTNAADSSSYANTAILQGAPYSTWSSSGKFGGALHLNSTDGSSTNLDGVNAPAAAQIDNLSAKTIAAWVKIGPDNETVIAQKYAAGNDNGWLLRRVNDTEISFTNWFTAATVDVTWGSVLANNTSIWQHVALTFPGASTDNASLYVNGTLVSSTGATSGSPMGDDSSAELKIGNHADWPSAAVDGGYLDDVRVYNYVMSAPEIAALAGLGADTTTGLQGHWKLDESSGTSAADSSGNGNTGTTSGSPTWTTGQIDGGLSFDGTDDCIVIPYTADLELSTGESITIAGWHKSASVVSDTIVFSDNIGNMNYVLGFDSSGYITFSYNDTGQTYSSSAAYLATDTWQHIAFSFTPGTGSSAKIYVNGAPVSGSWSSGTGNVAPIVDGRPVSVGCWNTSGTPDTDYVSADLDDIRIYNRILAGADIATLAQAFPGDCTGPKGLKGEMIYNSTKTMLQYCDGTSWVAVGKNAGSYASDMIAHWKFDETSGTSAADSTGNGNTGTLTNSPAWQGTAGKRGGAILLDGTNDYVTAGDINAAEGIGAITVSTWVKHSVAGETQHVYKSNCDGANDSWEIYSGYPNTDGTAAFMIGSSDGTISNSGLGTTDTSDGSWHMLTGVYDGAYIRIYVDGVEESSTSYPGITIHSNTHNVEIGGRCNGGGSGHYVNGLVDEVRIYGRALSPSEITDLYNATNGTPGVETRTVFLATNSGAKYNGNLGGIAGANTKCNTEAAAAGLLGTYMAWISLTANATNDPNSLFTGINGSYTYLLPSGTKVADNWADLTDATLDAAINENASGTSQTSGNVWTNVTTAGARDGSTSNTHGCATWGTALNTRSANVGTAGNTDNTWTDTGGTATCDTTAYLYCFQQ